MSYNHFGGGQMYDHYDGTPCANCESEPASSGTLFCSQDCQNEYEGTGEFSEEPHDTIIELEMQ